MRKDIKIYLKEEKRPPFLNSELGPLYDSTDLSLTYVFDCCLSLKPLKGIEINSMQVEFWYKEFLRLGWKKKHFDKQLESVKRAKLFNRIDLADWLQTEIMFNEIDLENKIQQRIKFLIGRGNFLKNKKIELTEEDKQAIDLAEAKQAEFNYNSGMYEARETWQQERRRLHEEKFKK